jgi:Flp pilus assembly protein TadG
MARPLTRRLEGKTRGQALIYMSIIIVVLLGFAALVADGGLIWLNRRAMQNAVDASALAAAQELPLSEKKFASDLTRTGDKACQYTEVVADSADIFNRVSGMTVANCVDKSYQTATGAGSCPAGSTTVGVLVCETAVPYDSDRVRASKQYSPTFGPLLKLLPIGVVDPTITINVQATAVVGSLKGLCTFPIFQAQDLLEAAGIWQPDGFGNYVEYNKATIMKTSADNISGNFMALQVDGSSSKDQWRDYGAVDRWLLGYHV